nr:helix-turn-helix domain-containing protein [Ruania zhangjianzhongii]
MDGLERWRILRLHVEDGIALTALARETGTAVRTLQRWNRRYQHRATANRTRTVFDTPGDRCLRDSRLRPRQLRLTDDVIEAAASILVIGN